MMMFRIRLFVVGILLYLTTLALAQPSETPPNFLLIVIDDMADWAGYQDYYSQTMTPNLDELNRQGLTFHNAHVNAPVCMSSRSSFLTGLSPAQSGILSNQDDWSDEFADTVVTLPDAFSAGGWHTFNVGKMFHSGSEHKHRWDETAGGHRNPSYDEIVNEGGWEIDGGWQGLDWSQTPSIDDMGDHVKADKAIEFLETYDGDKPFMMAVGLSATHREFHCPAEFLPDNDPADTELTPYLVDDLGDIPQAGWQSNEIKAQFDAFPDSAEAIRSLTRAYATCVNYIDYELGRLMDALESSDWADNTVVIFTSDHGFHIFEKDHLGKVTLWERSTRVPFIIRMPDHNESGYPKQFSKAVNIGAIYPTMLDIAGIPDPYADCDLYRMDFASLLPVIEGDRSGYTSYATTWKQNGSVAIRTFGKRYIVHADGSMEIYNLKNDPNEWDNLADPDNYPQFRLNQAEKLWSGEFDPL